MRLAEAADNDEILGRLSHAAETSGVTLTYAHKSFYVRLLDYAKQCGVALEQGLMIGLSVKALSETLDVPLRTTVECLNRLTACEALTRTAGNKTFPRSVASTIIEKRFYEKRSGGVRSVSIADLFNNDECIVINSNFKGFTVAEFTKSRLLASLTFSRSVSADEDILSLLDGIIEKVEPLSDEDWDRIRARLPFRLIYDEENNVDEVPDDAE